MTTSSKTQNRHKLNRPSLRKHARPPKKRSAVGQTFTAANLATALNLQHCTSCGQVQYPPRELCSACLGDLIWRPTSGNGAITSRLDLHHSLWEFFKRKLSVKPWPIASVTLDCGPTLIAHLDVGSFAASQALDVTPGTPVEIFSHTDCSLQCVLIATAAGQELDSAKNRYERAEQLGLLSPALKPGGI
ncbi:MAG: putative OB-fold protein [Alcanivorax sp.]|jgi:uncharacterized OB-fold protein